MERWRDSLGEPIPIIHCEKCGIVPVDEKDLPVVLPEIDNYEPSFPFFLFILLLLPHIPFFYPSTYRHMPLLHLSVPFLPSSPSAIPSPSSSSSTYPRCPAAAVLGKQNTRDKSFFRGMNTSGKTCCIYTHRDTFLLGNSTIILR